MSAVIKILSLFLFVIYPRITSAQVVVYFGNRVLPDPPDRLVRDTSGQPVVGTNFIAQLLYETASGNFTAHPVIARFYGSTDFQGWWNGGYRTLTSAGGVGVAVRMQVRVWDGGFSGDMPLTFEDAIAAGNQWGASDIFTYAEFLSLPPANGDRYMAEFRGFQLVPEPSTWALLVGGVGFLLWRWRRKE
jgi:hypothetical protein